MSYFLISVLFLLGVVYSSDSLSPDSISHPPIKDVWNVTFTTTVGIVTLEIHNDWAPIGAKQFYNLIVAKFYDEAAFFRVVPDFVVQFGISGIPAENKKWSHPIKDDPVLVSNTKGTLVYATAGPNTRTTQLFINYKDNPHLDSSFAPFGKVVEGMAVLESIYNPTPGNSEGVDQADYEMYGNTWIKAQYPKIDFITQARQVGYVEYPLPQLQPE